MKIFKAHLKRSDIEVEYTVKAETKEEALEKLYYICGERNLKVKDL